MIRAHTLMFSASGGLKKRTATSPSMLRSLAGEPGPAHWPVRRRCRLKAQSTNNRLHEYPSQQWYFKLMRMILALMLYLPLCAQVSDKEALAAQASQFLALMRGSPSLPLTAI